MSYIVNLSLVLQTLYLVSDNQKLSRRAIKLAVTTYLRLPTSGEVHAKIQEHVGQLAFLEHANSDALDKIIQLMELYSINAQQISDCRATLSTVDADPDETW